MINQHPAKNGRDHDRQAFDDRLQADAHGMAICRQGFGDEGKSGRQRETSPGKEEEHAADDRAPVGNKKNEGVAGDGNHVENEKGATVSPAVHQDAAGIGIDGPEQSAQAVEKADDENGGPQFLQILGEKSHPQFFAGADAENGDKQNDEVAAQSEKLDEVARQAGAFFHRRSLVFHGQFLSHETRLRPMRRVQKMAGTARCAVRALCAAESFFSHGALSPCGSWGRPD